MQEVNASIVFMETNQTTLENIEDLDQVKVIGEIISVSGDKAVVDFGFQMLEVPLCFLLPQ